MEGREGMGSMLLIQNKRGRGCTPARREHVREDAAFLAGVRGAGFRRTRRLSGRLTFRDSRTPISHLC